MKAILDTNVILDLQRHQRYADAWIKAADITDPCITPGIFLEVLGGTQLPYKQTVRKILHLFTDLPHTAAVYRQAEA